MSTESIRVGVDLVVVAHVADSLSRFGDRYASRVYTKFELEDTFGAAQASGLAARFAAKEAAIKVLAPEHGRILWRSIEVRRGPGGAPTLCLHGEARDLAEDASLDHWSVSMSHEAAMAVAVVIASSE